MVDTNVELIARLFDEFDEQAALAKLTRERTREPFRKVLDAWILFFATAAALARRSIWRPAGRSLPR
jgi:hypothetical protein